MNLLVLFFTLLSTSFSWADINGRILFHVQPYRNGGGDGSGDGGGDGAVVDE